MEHTSIIISIILHSPSKDEYLHAIVKASSLCYTTSVQWISHLFQEFPFEHGLSTWYFTMEMTSGYFALMKSNYTFTNWVQVSPALIPRAEGWGLIIRIQIDSLPNWKPKGLCDLISPNCVEKPLSKPNRSIPIKIPQEDPTQLIPKQSRRNLSRTLWGTRSNWDSFIGSSRFQTRCS